MNIHGMSAASRVSGPLVTSGWAAQSVGGDEQDDDPQVRALLSHPLVTLLPPTPVSSTSIRLTWKVSVEGGESEEVLPVLGTG